MPTVTQFPGPSDNRHRRRKLKSLAFVPTLITIGNLLCGFAAIHFALRAMYDFGAGVPVPTAGTLSRSFWELMPPSPLSVGATLVLVGMVFDLFDGLIARVTRSTTNFGGQLDSLADVVSFGVAPATLMVAFMTRQLAQSDIFPSPTSEHFFGRTAWVTAAIYVAFTAVRLARYNVEHAKADFDHRTFRGMPSPGAACVMVAMILFQDQVGPTGKTIILYCMPGVATAIAFLMVSRIPYRRFHRAYFLGKQPFSHVITFVLVFAIFWSYKAPTLLVIVLWYAASGPVFYLARILRNRHREHVDTTAEPTTNDTTRRHA